MTEPNPILSLSTTDYDRPRVDIDGVAYEMRSPDELTVPMLRKFDALGKRLTDEADFDKIASAIQDGVALLMIDLPNEVRDRLTLTQQSKIIQVFTRLANQGAVETTIPPGNSSPSHDSNASTGAA